MSTDVFKFDPNFLENEEKYKEIRSEILGENSDEESGSEESSGEEDGDEGDEGNSLAIASIILCLRTAVAVEDKEGIEDRTETNLVNLRRTIYLTIMNALNYEEAVHKLLKVQLKEGEEVCLFSHLEVDKIALMFSLLRSSSST
jgi:pre-mRNA-splicing factor CWC22